MTTKLFYSSDILVALKYINDKAFCIYTFDKALVKYNTIKDSLLEKDKEAIGYFLAKTERITLHEGHSHSKCLDLANAIKQIMSRKTCLENFVFEYGIYQENERLTCEPMGEMESNTTSGFVPWQRSFYSIMASLREANFVLERCMPKARLQAVNLW